MQMCRSRPSLALIVLQVPAAGLSLAASPLALVLQPQRSGVVNQSFCRGYIYLFVSSKRSEMNLKSSLFSVGLFHK